MAQFIRRCFLYLWLVVAVMGQSVIAGELRMELCLRAQGDSRAFRYERRLTQSEADELMLGGNSLQRHLVQGLKRYAAKRGYREEVYGADFWKIVSVESWDWYVVDTTSGRKVIEGRAVRHLDGSARGSFD